MATGNVPLFDADVMASGARSERRREAGIAASDSGGLALSSGICQAFLFNFDFDQKVGMNSRRVHQCGSENLALGRQLWCRTLASKMLYKRCRILIQLG